MRYAQIRKMDISNGKGIGVSIFFQGCTHHCKNCFNQETWDFKGGHELTKVKKKEIIELASREYIDFVSFLGGEPFDQPLNELYAFIKEIKQTTNKRVYIWSGYTYEQIIADENKKRILDYVDFLVDGEFVEELKDFNLLLRGSSNQKIWEKINNIWKIIS